MKRFRIVVLTLISTLVLFSCTRPMDPLFYAARKGEKNIYLFGSFHAADKSFYPLPEKVEQAFSEAQGLAVEVDLREMKAMSGEMNQFILQKGFYREGMTLEKALGDKANAFKEYCKTEGIPWKQLNPLKPWMVTMVLTETGMKKAGIDPQFGIDLYFMEKWDKEEIISLESLQGQLGMLAGIPEDVQLLMLMENVEENKGLKKELKELAALWKKGDETKFEEAVFKSRSENTELEPYYDALFDRRNRQMALNINDALKRDDISTLFVVIGAGHLLGEKGVPAFLEAMGYHIERL